MSEIKINPLHGLIRPEKRRIVPRPKWICKHKEAVLLDGINLIYRCIVCNPTNLNIKVIPNVSSLKTDDTLVTVSPSSGSSSPKVGFK
jgi:hypothetical protein